MIQTTLRPSTLGGLRLRLRDRWPALSEERIAGAGGSLDKLIDAIHAETGESRPTIKRDLRRILAA
jgi:hypothetical protein